MAHILEPAREIPVIGEYEAVVAGGGIAGIAAAAAAARNGARVLLIEREYALGGMATLGLVTIFLPLCDGRGNQLVAGLGEELLRLSILHGAELPPPEVWTRSAGREERSAARYIARFNPHLFALEAERLLLDLKVELLYGTTICAAAMTGDRIDALILENKSGRSAVRVGRVVDCTGDADIAALAGARTALYGRGNRLASWYYFAQGGRVDLKMFGLADLPERSSGRVINDHTDYRAEARELSGDLRFSGVDGPELSRAVTAAHGQMYADILEKRAEQPDFSPVTISTIPLVRMSRRLVGSAEQGVDTDHVFLPDSIGMTGDWRRSGPAFELSYGALWGKEVRNLICAGRCISVTDEMWDVTRVIPPCAVTGQAAGTAAAMTEDFSALKVDRLQARLAAQGVLLHCPE